MKRISIFSVCLTLLALGLALASCDNGSTFNNAADDPLLFYGTSGGKAVTVEISQTDPSRAVLTPKTGDFYEIKWANDVISKGTISITGNIWLFNPSANSPGVKTQFSASYSNGVLSFSSIPGTGISNLTVSVNGNNGNNGNTNTTGNDGDDSSNGNNSNTGTGTGLPVLTGTVTIDNTSPQVGDTLTATYVLGNGSGTPTWQWLRNDSPITSGSATYTVDSADVGYVLKARVSYADQSGSVFGVTAVVVAAGSGSSGLGTETDPFIVDSVAALIKVGTGTDGWWTDSHYKQTVDLDLFSISNWIPIGKSGDPFMGSYDGDGHTISNLTITRSTEDYIGLFGYLADNYFSPTKVKNVGLINVSIDGNMNVGGLVGFSNSCTVENCYVKGGTVKGNQNAGGVVGHILEGSIVTNCYATCNVEGGSIGGVGGVVGLSQQWSIYPPEIKNCYSTGNVSGSSSVGGIVGDLGLGKLINCFAKGSVHSSSSTGNVGGVAGFVRYSSATDFGSVTGSVALNSSVTTVRSIADRIGRVVGDCEPGASLTANYALDLMDIRYDISSLDLTKTPLSVGSTTIDGDDVSDAMSKTPGFWDTTMNWDTNIWEIGTNLPKLKGVGGQ